MLAKQKGQIYQVQDDCELRPLFSLDLSHFSLEPKQLNNSFVTFRRKLTALYENGLPLKDVAISTKEKAWLLLKDEKRDESWLYEVNLTNKQVTFKEKLTHNVNKLIFRKKHLILLSESNATVDAYNVED